MQIQWKCQYESCGHPFTIHVRMGREIEIDRPSGCPQCGRAFDEFDREDIINNALHQKADDDAAWAERRWEVETGR